jgi:YVTN family beta-propeller protein
MVAILALGVFAMGQAVVAEARFAYVANAGSGDVSVIDTETGQVVGEPISADNGSWAVALTPDGKFLFVANYSASNVSVINTDTNQVLGQPIKVASSGFRATGVAISPDGKTAYVTSEGGFDPGLVTSIDVATRQVVGQPLKLKHGAGGIAIAPDGTRAYVSSEGESGLLWLVYPGGSSVARQVDVGAGHIGHIAVTPDGKYVLATDSASQGVSVIDASSFEVIGPPVKVGAGPQGLAISPNGSYAYVANLQAASISVIDISANFQVSDEIALNGRPWEIAFSPSGDRAYVSTDSPAGVTVIDTKTKQVIGEPIEVGSQPEGIAVVPNQPPTASFSNSSPLFGVPVSFDASGSTDPDGQIARYDWNFGDGQSAPSGGLTPSNTYGTPGTYPVNLTVTDNEGCSTAFVFTGQTAYCSGGPSANQTQTIAIAAPAARHGIALAARLVRVKGDKALLRLRCQSVGPCQGIVKLLSHIRRNGLERHRGSGSKTRKARREVIGSSRFAVGAGRAKVVRVKLSRNSRKSLGVAPRHRLKGDLAGTGVKHRVVLLWQSHRRARKG